MSPCHNIENLNSSCLIPCTTTQLQNISQQSWNYWRLSCDRRGIADTRQGSACQNHVSVRFALKILTQQYRYCRASLYQSLQFWRKQCNKEAFMKHFAGTHSADFDPDGPVNAANHYVQFNTICDATQVFTEFRDNVGRNWKSSHPLHTTFGLLTRIPFLPLTNDKTLFTNRLKTHPVWDWRSFSWLVVGIPPTWPTNKRFPSMPALAPSTSTMETASMATTPLHTKPSLVKSSRNPAFKTWPRMWS